MTFQTVFFNDFGRLRSGWRFAIFLLLLVIFSIMLQAIAFAILGILPIEYSDSGFLNEVFGRGVLLIATVISGWFCGSFLEHLPFRALGVWFTKNWLKDLLFGLLLGVLALSFAVLIAVVAGGLEFTRNQNAAQSAILLTLGYSLIIFAFAAAAEEVLFRGYMLQTFARANLAWFAILLPSLFFGAVHLGNNDSSWLSTINTFIAGILFSVAYLKTRTLWLPFGLHLMWNWVQGSFFGIEVSGTTEVSTAPILIEIDHGPIWLTGENYGIEGGIACTIALIIFTLVIWFLPNLSASDEMMELTSKENEYKTTEHSPELSNNIGDL
jgi:membrane protease YdiL (CAAX protease family)